MRIGFDLDGTVADMHDALAREAVRLFPGVDVSSVPNSTNPTEKPGGGGADGGNEVRLSTSGLSSGQMKELWAAACAKVNFWESLPEIEPGALTRLYEVATARKWEVIFITSRPESAGDTAQTQSYRWLMKMGFRTPSVFVCHGSRGKIASALALDVFVDDRPENCLDIAIDSQARAILVWRGDEGKVPGSARQLGIGSVSSISQCLDILETLDDGTEESGSVVSRLKSLLGLKSKSSRPEAPRRTVAAGFSRG